MAPPEIRPPAMVTSYSNRAFRGYNFLQSSLMVCVLLLFLIPVISGLSINDNVPFLPTDLDAMVRQAASAVQTAFADDNIHRQTIRLPLSDTMYGGKEESFVADRAIGWQGGPQETYRFLSPMAQQLLRQVSNYEDNTSGLTPKVQEQVLLDYDGSSLLNAESPMGPLYDSLALLQPNADQYYFDFIGQMEDQFSDTPDKAKRLFLLINPAWRDASSWGFFQAKRAKERILDRYETTFALDQFIMKGNKMSLLKAWPCNWCVYWTPLPQPGSPPTDPKLLGTFPKRPEYWEMEKLLLAEL